MKKCLSILLVVCMCSSVAFAEIHVWTFKNGNTMEAEYVAMSGGVVSLRNARGKVKKVPRNELSKEDMRYIELLNPPKLDLDLGKKTNQRIYPPTYNDQELPRQTVYTLSAKVKQASSKPYSRMLTLEFFNIGEENNGDKNILYSYQKESFTLGASGAEFQLTTQEIPVTAYVSYGQRRGETYKGYMMIVKDERGKIIASKSTRDEWLQIADTLSQLPVGRSFDPATGERCWPTRPNKFY